MMVFNIKTQWKFLPVSIGMYNTSITTEMVLQGYGLSESASQKQFYNLP